MLDRYLTSAVQQTFFSLHLRYCLRSILLAGFLLSASFTQAQPAGIKMPVSPDAASLGKFGVIPVSHYTGIPNISIPLHTIETKQLKVDIALSYHAGGIRVEEEASSVGLGWALNAGGVITRSIRGLDDVSNDQNNRVGYPFAGPLLASTATNDLDEAQLPTQNISPYRELLCQTNTTDQQDTQPDVFFYNFGGKSGKFVLKKVAATGNKLQAQLLTKEKIRFEIDISANPTQWVATVEDGTKYIFAAIETSQAVTYPNYVPVSCIGSGCNPITSWYLSRIVSPKGEAITFVYNLFRIRNQPMRTQKKYTYSGDYADLSGQATPACPEQWSPTTPLPVDVFNYSTTNSLILDSIAYAGGSVVFKTATRLDIQSALNNTPRIAAIVIKNKVGDSYVETKRFVLDNDDYFNGSSYQQSSPEIRAIFLRLKLNGITEVSAGIRKEPFRFAYTTTTLPAKDEAGRDHWGYPNGVLNNTSFIPGMTVKLPVDVQKTNTPWLIPGADREAHAGPTLAGVLTQITYPTKGYTKFSYEQNDYSNLDAATGPADLKIGGLRISQIESGGSDTPTKSLTYVYKDLSATPRSSGKRMSPNKNYYFQPVYRYAECGSQSSPNGTYYHYYVLVRTSYSNLPLGDGAQGQFVGYSTVTELDGVDGANGKTIYRFHNDEEILPPVTPKTNRHPVASTVGGTPNSIPPKNGLLQAKEVYRNERGAFKLISRLSNTYEVTDVEKTQGMNYMQELCDNTEPSNIYYMVKFYDYESSWVKLTQTIEEQFDQNNETKAIATTTKFHYDNPAHYQVTSTEKIMPDGKTLTTYLKYPADYSSPTNPAIAAMSGTEHMHSLPVETYTTVKSASLSEAVISGQYVTYGLVSGKPLPVRTSQFRATAPVPLTTFSPSTSEQGGPQYTTTALLEYNPVTSDVLTERNTSATTPALTDQVRAYQWGYENQLLTAVFPNASRTQPDPNNPSLGNEASYLGFESGTARNGNPAEDYWSTGLGPANHPVTTAHTGRFGYRVGQVGRYDFNFGPGRTFSPDHINGRYRLSAWVKTDPNFQAGAGRLVLSVSRQNGTQLGTGSAEVSFGDTNGEWQYIETEINLGSVRTNNSSISAQERLQLVAFSCNAGSNTPNLAGFVIDDMRFEPVGTLATTYTYDAGWRVPLSISDANSRPTYYEYDDLGRLRVVRDYLRQILKHYEYHYKR